MVSLKVAYLCCGLTKMFTNPFYLAQ